MSRQQKAACAVQAPSCSLRAKVGGPAIVTLAVALLAMTELSRAALPSEPFWQSRDNPEREAAVSELLPPGIKVMPTELEGPVFANEKGMTLYIWPQQQLRNGNLGDRRNSGVATCGDTIHEETSGLMSPYPPGYLLPDLDKRRSCEQVWK